MIKYAIIVFLGIAFALPTYAGHYMVNPHTGRMEYVEQGDTLQLNPHTRQFEYAPQNARPRINPMQNGRWEMAPPNSVPRHNPHTGKWEYRQGYQCPQNSLDLKLQTDFD